MGRRAAGHESLGHPVDELALARQAAVVLGVIQAPLAPENDQVGTHCRLDYIEQRRRELDGCDDQREQIYDMFLLADDRSVDEVPKPMNELSSRNTT